MGEEEPPTNKKEWPPELLQRIAQIRHNPRTEELPCEYKFVVLFRDDHAIIQGELERGPNAGTFDTLKEATKVATDLFTRLTLQWGVSKEEGTRFCETDDWMRYVNDDIEEPTRHRPRHKQVVWNINSRGLLSMAALDFMGMQARVVVYDFQVEEDSDSS